ncbi:MULTISPECIES: cysteine hydrolase family protein [unclassified Mycoplasma]|uniref:cysteine hydrolase family protein n=1 Tax=unclassified Mycoplasma TaxID=2683645 RepID=UPI00211BC611|nr:MULTISPECIES: isochorismatase family cysteine hydrolase [unclassified Mycoplasma]UUM19564.1 cysteine hydrolase [Mycoplasma sp. 1578d]UUM24483.1 cysteine hydrolase [Mycoplasma sp. 3686d]
MNNKLIIVVDMLNGFAHSGPLASENITKIIQPIARELSKGDDVIFVCDAHNDSDLEMKQYPLHCQKDSTQAQIVSELKNFITPTNVYYKNTTNAFWELLALNIWNEYDQFLIVGCCTDICILQLALSIRTYFNKINMDKEIIVDSSLVATYDSNEHNAQEFHQFALKLMAQAGVKII